MSDVQTNPTGSEETKRGRISGKRLFFLYTWPCVIHQIVINNQKISREVILRLEEILQNGTEPDIKIFENYFPDPLKGYLKFCQESGKEPWSYDLVSEYWRNHHNHDKKGGLKHDLFEGEIIEISPIDGIIFKVEVKDRQLPAKNIFNLDVKKGDRVVVHKNIIIEIL